MKIPVDLLAFESLFGQKFLMMDSKPGQVLTTTCKQQSANSDSSSIDFQNNDNLRPTRSLSASIMRSATENNNIDSSNQTNNTENITSRRFFGLTNGITRSRQYNSSLDDSIVGGNLSAGYDFNDGVDLDKKRLEMSFDFIDAAALVFSMSSYLFDIMTDITVAIFHYLNQDFWYSSLTLAFIIIPSLITTTVSMRWYVTDSRVNGAEKVSSKTWLIRSIFHILQVGPVLRYYQSLQYGLKFREAKTYDAKRQFYLKMIYEDADSALLRVFEAFIEAAPQLLLQIKILHNRIVSEGGLPFTDDDFWTTAVQVVSITTSLTSIAWALVIYRKSLRKSLQNKILLKNFLPLAFMFTFEFFSICARVIALSMLISSSLMYQQIILAIASHWLLMSSWVMSMKTQFCETKWEERGWALLLGFILIFCYLNAVDRPTRYKYIIFYSLLFFESIPIMYINLFWKTQENVNFDLRLGLVTIHYICLLCAIVFMIIYYRFFHPKRSTG